MQKKIKRISKKRRYYYKYTDDTLHDTCPARKEIKIGSHACRMCENNLQYSIEDEYIICKHLEGNRNVR